MSGFQCLQSSRRALYRVFVSPLERHEPSLQRQLLPVLHGRARALQAQSLVQSRSLVTSPRRHKKGPSSTAVPNLSEDGEASEEVARRGYTTKQDIEKSGRGRMPQDHEIRDPKIMVLDGGVREGPLLTRHVLARLSEGDSLRMITPYVPGRPRDGIPEQFALCKVVNKKDEYERQKEVRERKRVARATSTKTKELELNWGIGENDLQTKLRQLDGFLSKGMRVEVVFGQKRGGKKVEKEAAKEVLEGVRAWVGERAAKEWKETDGQIGRTVRMYLEGTAK